MKDYKVRGTFDDFYLVDLKGRTYYLFGSLKTRGTLLTEAQFMKMMEKLKEYDGSDGRGIKENPIKGGATYAMFTEDDHRVMSFGMHVANKKDIKIIKKIEFKTKED
jgi:hypothetical protein